jgi:hypothetical protein
LWWIFAQFLGGVWHAGGQSSWEGSGEKVKETTRKGHLQQTEVVTEHTASSMSNLIIGHLKHTFSTDYLRDNVIGLDPLIRGPIKS